MRFLTIVGRSFIDFFRDGGMTLASSISYFTMMALVPFCLFLLTLFGYLLGRYPEFYSFFFTRLSSLFPSVTREITRDLVTLYSAKDLGRLSLVLYGFLSYPVFGSIERSLNVIFKVKKKRHLVFSFVVSLTVVTVITLLLITSFAAGSLVHLLRGLRPPYVPGGMGGVTALIVGYVIPFFLVLLTTTMVYALLPNAKVRLLNALKGALFTTLFLEAAKHLFAWYVIAIAEFGRLYGPLTTFILFLLWMFYSSSIFLVGAEITHNLGAGEGKTRRSRK